LDFVKCPACGYDDADSSRGVKMHYSYADDDTHPGKLPKYIFRCVQCGTVDEGSNPDQMYCSRDCRILDEVGTLKHRDEDFLIEQIEEKGKRAVDVAKEINVKPKAVHKWVREYDIGNDYECPSCDRTFATSQGVSKHHEDEHGESIRGNTYECAWCGEENWTPRRKDDKLFPKYCNDDCWGESMEGENNPNKDDGRKKKISETMEKRHEAGLGYDGGRRDSEWMMENVIEKRDDSYLKGGASEEALKKISKSHKEKVRKGEHHLQDPEIRSKIVRGGIEKVEETGNTVLSSLEKEIDLLLYDSDLEYKHESDDGFPAFDIGDKFYIPDFTSGEYVIEVKGEGGYVHNPELTERKATFMKENDDYIYIVVGTVEIPCDIYIEWEDREELIEVLS